MHLQDFTLLRVVSSRNRLNFESIQWQMRSRRRQINNKIIYAQFIANPLYMHCMALYRLVASIVWRACVFRRRFCLDISLNARITHMTKNLFTFVATTTSLCLWHMHKSQCTLTIVWAWQTYALSYHTNHNNGEQIIMNEVKKRRHSGKRRNHKYV